MFNKLLKFTFISFLCLPLLSCTRKVDSVARVSFNTDSIGGLAYEDTVVILINITGQGEPLYYMWQKCRELVCEPGTETPPTELYFEMPAGQNRLFQVLAAFEDSITGTTGFQYGDKTQNVPVGDVTISINLTEIGLGGEEFDFAGRYALDNTPTYPSGVIDTYYTPPGKPKMYIESSYMFDGYFKLFGIDNAGFDYILNAVDGSSYNLFTDVNLSSFSGNQVIHVRFPQRGEFQGSWYEEEPENLILGYFGASLYTAGKQICYDNTEEVNISGLCIDDVSCNDPPGLATDPNLDWQPDPLTPSTEGNTTGDEIVRVSGGVANLASCTSDSLNTSEKKFDISQYTSGNFDRIRGFDGPFYNNAGNTVAAYGTSTNDIIWNYVSNPGVGKTFDGVDVFILDASSGFDYDMFFLDCSDLYNDPNLQTYLLNYTAVDTDLNGTASGLTRNSTSDFSPNYDMDGNDAVIICPYKNSEYLIGTAVYGMSQ